MRGIGADLRSRLTRDGPRTCYSRNRRADYEVNRERRSAPIPRSTGLLRQNGNYGLRWTIPNLNLRISQDGCHPNADADAGSAGDAEWGPAEAIVGKAQLVCAVTRATSERCCS